MGANHDLDLDLTLSDASFYKNLLDHVSDGVYFVDRERRIHYWNEGAVRLTGYERNEMIGRFCQDDTLCHVDAAGHELCQQGCPLTACVADGQSHEAQVFLRHKQGRRVPVRVRVQPIRNAEGSVVGVVEIFSDETAHVTAQRKTEELERLAFLDLLTQTPNRRFLEMTLQTSLDEFKVHEDPFGLMMIDLDRFKRINDESGHDVGDRALQETAKTLSAALRATDVVGRWGGDEFVAIVRHVDTLCLTMLAERCCSLVRRTTLRTGEDREIALSVSIGAALATQEDTVETLFKRADGLLYQGKIGGRDQAKCG
jgi:diguanylate cyclase (GGDEF)-like protein/PAS domain S-box-containing protein